MIKEKAFGKINLGLSVIGKRNDGYHELDMIMTPIDISDDLEFVMLSKDVIQLEIKGDLGVIKEDNIVFKAANLLKETHKVTSGVQITLTKRIPIQAGLGGGSADAAATLRGLNQLWELNLTLEDLAKLSINLGSDVPFCVYNQTARVRGRGEIIEFIDAVPSGYVILVHPGFYCSTKEVFNHAVVGVQNSGRIDALQEAIQSSDIAMVAKKIYNDLEQAVYQIRDYRYKEIQNIKEELRNAGALGQIMTGSGSVVYGLAVSDKHAQKIKQNFFNKNKEKFEVSSFDKKPYVIEVVRLKTQTKSIQSKREPIKITEVRTPMGAPLQIKANGWIRLLKYQRSKQLFEVITPVQETDAITVQRIKEKNVYVWIDEVRIEGALQENIFKVLQLIDAEYGLEIKVKRNISESFLMNDQDSFFAAILNHANRLFQKDSLSLVNHFGTQIKKYMFLKTVEVSNVVKETAQMPYSFVVVAESRMRKIEHVTPDSEKAMGFKKVSLLRALAEENFYQVANEIEHSNSFHLYKAAKADSQTRRYIQDYEKMMKMHRVSRFILLENQIGVIFFLRYEKDAKELCTHLNKEMYIKTAQMFRIKSDVTHKPIKNKYLVEKVIDKNNKIEVVEDTVVVSNKNENIPTMPNIPSRDLEGIFYLHSPGSLFKQYDFIDFAQYFYQNFHKRTLFLDIEGRKVSLYFHMNNLPHIFGLHKIDDKETYKGKKGAFSLLNGEISQASLKRRLEKSLYDEILQKTQSTVLVLNDLFANRNLQNIIVMDKKSVTKENSQMVKLEYAIGRMMAKGKQDEINLIGIGYEEADDRHYFMTSFLWKPSKPLSQIPKLHLKIKENHFE